MTTNTFLLLNLALAFYFGRRHLGGGSRYFPILEAPLCNRFPSCPIRPLAQAFHRVFTPLALAVVGSLVLIGYHPARSPGWAIWRNLACQNASLLLTAVFWGRWQAALSRDDLGPESPYLAKILATH